MAVFFCKLVAPRPTFLHEITPPEMAAMQGHAAYWMPHVASGDIRAMGPVDDPKGTFGMMVLEAASREAVDALIAKDPILAHPGFAFEISAMPHGVVGRGQ